MYFTIYKTTNLINGKFYIGKHQTKNPHDSYLGSGKVLKQAIQKHGKENFKKEILFIFDNENEMNAKEKEILTEEFISSENNYNSGVGGEGGAHFRGRRHSQETREKIKLGIIRNNKEVPRFFPEESRRKMSEANRRRVWSDASKRKLSATKIRIAAEKRSSVEFHKLDSVGSTPTPATI